MQKKPLAFAAAAAFFSAALFLVPSAPSSAQSGAYPSRPIQLLVGLAPGSVQDAAARIVSNRAGQLLGVQIVVENRPGAGTMIASSAVAKARPDGHTLLQNGVALSVNPSLYKEVPYDAARDFVPVAFLVNAPQLLVVRPTLPVRNLAELLEKYKGSDELSFASPGAGTMPHLAAGLFVMRSGLKTRHVPYKGGAPALADVMAGRVDLLFVTPVMKAHIDALKVRALAIASEERVETLPDLPTFAEAGLALPEINAGAWFGVLAPRGTPDGVVRRLNQAFNAALNDTAVRVELKRLALVPKPMSPEAFGAFMRDDMNRWPPIIAAAGLKAEQ
jgi:tripartite-type tricarboxylate transporter receptor subunit TctC